MARWHRVWPASLQIFAPSAAKAIAAGGRSRYPEVDTAEERNELA